MCQRLWTENGALITIHTLNKIFLGLGIEGDCASHKRSILESYDSIQALKEVQLAGLRTVVEREKAGIIITLYGFFIYDSGRSIIVE